MGRVRSSVPRSRVPFPRRLLLDPATLRYWLAVVVLALVVAATVVRAVAQARSARTSWGETTTVLVARAPAEVGDELTDLVHEVAWPRALVPSSAVSSLPDGARAAVAIGAGTPVTTSLLDRDGDGRPTSGRRTVALPVGPAPLPAETGDVVDVWASADASLAWEGQGSARRLATDAVVVSSDDRRVVVAVEPSEVAALAEVAGTSVVTLVGSG